MQRREFCLFNARTYILGEQLELNNARAISSKFFRRGKPAKFVLRVCKNYEIVPASLGVKGTEQYFPVVLFIMLHKVVPSLEFVDEIF